MDHDTYAVLDKLQSQVCNAIFKLAGLLDKNGRRVYQCPFEFLKVLCTKVKIWIKQKERL